MPRLLRLTALEQRPNPYFLDRATEATGITKPDIWRMLERAGVRVAAQLGLRSSPFSVEPSDLRIAGIAGLVRLGQLVELEVVPKFLHAEDTNWREDFLYLATLSKHGRLLPREDISAAATSRGDLATLVARAMINMYWGNHRRPLRTYELHGLHDYAIDGDVDPEAFWMPNPQGFRQDVVVYTRTNRFNAVIAAGARALLPEVADPQTRRQLQRLCESLIPQRPAARYRPPRVPNRARRWQLLYDLASEVLDGFGIGYQMGVFTAPGYVVPTWRVWEDLVTLAVRTGFGSSNVSVQSPSVLGVRTGSYPGAGSSSVFVYPDLLVREGPSAAPVLVDAKYKGRYGTSTRIDEADIYEALAFASAANASRVVLVYPSISDGSALPRTTGRCTVLETVEAQGIRITALAAEVSGVSASGGVRKFARQLAAAIRLESTHSAGCTLPHSV